MASAAPSTLTTSGSSSVAHGAIASDFPSLCSVLLRLQRSFCLQARDLLGDGRGEGGTSSSFQEEASREAAAENPWLLERVQRIGRVVSVLQDALRRYHHHLERSQLATRLPLTQICCNALREVRGWTGRLTRPLPLPLALLRVLQRNVAVGVNRSKTPAAAAAITTGTLATEAVSAEQRAERLKLLTGRVALLADASPDVASRVSPALKQYAALTTQAEARFMQSFWKFSLKAATLVESPKLKERTDEWRSALQAYLSGTSGRTEGPEAAAAASAVDHYAYIYMLDGNHGILRLSIQRCLLLDVTFDPRSETWRLVNLFWTLFIPPTGAEEVPLEEEYGRYHRVLPGHGAEISQYLAAAYTKEGLVVGCLAATRLVLSLLIDLVAKQLEKFRDEVLGADLASLFVVDVQAGTHVAYQFECASFFVASSTPFLNTRLHGKCTIVGGVIVYEYRWGSETASRVIAQQLAPPHGALSSRPAGQQPTGLSDAAAARREEAEAGIVWDVEQWIWDAVSERSQSLMAQL